MRFFFLKCGSGRIKLLVRALRQQKKNYGFVKCGSERIEWLMRALGL